MRYRAPRYLPLINISKALINIGLDQQLQRINTNKYDILPLAWLERFITDLEGDSAAEGDTCFGSTFPTELRRCGVGLAAGVGPEDAADLWLVGVGGLGDGEPRELVLLKLGLLAPGLLLVLFCSENSVYYKTGTLDDRK